MTICNDFFLLCIMFPQPPSPNVLFFFVFTKVQMFNKNMQSPFLLYLWPPHSFLLLPPSLPHSMLSSPPGCHPTSFPFFNNNRLPQGFSFHFVMILTLLPFCHFPLNKETFKINIFFYILTPLQDEIDLGLNFNPKSGEVPPSQTLILNDYILLYVQPIP